MPVLALSVCGCYSFALHALDQSRPLRQLGQQNWQTDSGLPQNTVHAILQTRDGFLWLATEGGLVRFDGADFVVFDKRTVPAMRSNLVSSLAEDAEGTLWAGTAEGLLEVKDGHMRLFTTKDGLPGDAVLSLVSGRSDLRPVLWIITANGVAAVRSGRFESMPPLLPAVRTNEQPITALAADGTLWIATLDRVLHLGGGHVYGERILDSIPVPQAKALATGADGSLWIGTSSKLQHLTRHGLEPVALPAGTVVTALLSDGDDNLVVGTAAGLLFVRNGTAIVPDTKDAQAAAPARGAIEQLFRDRSGALWITTKRNLSRLARGAPLADLESIPIEDVVAFFEDREGDLWLGSDTVGLTVLREQKFTTWTTAEGLAGNNVRTVLSDRSGDLWAGTGGDGLSRLRGSALGKYTTSKYTTRDGLASDTVLSLAEVRDGSLLIGTPDGLDRLAGERAEILPDEEAMPDDFVRSIHADASDGSVWIGTRRGLVRKLDGRVSVWTHSDGLGSDVVGVLAPDRRTPGAMWIGTLGGLSHYVDSQLTNLTTGNGLSSDTITALLSKPDGSLWIGTNGGGLNLLRNGRITPVPAQSGLPETIYSILEDTRGFLWLGAPTGIYRVSEEQLAASAGGAHRPLDVSAYGTADGMRISECASGHPAAARAADGTLWFATLRGLSAINPERTRDNSLPPPVAIEAVTIDDRPVSAEGPFRVPAGSTRLAVHYAGLSFVAPSKVRFRYRLEGFDRGWIDAGGRRTAYYTNVPPGRYTFRVLAANNDGVWNEAGASLSFRVQPHYYQTWWFYTLIALLMCAIVYELYRVRVRQVELRFNAVLAERNRIAREIHDTLAQDIVGIGVQLELVSRLLMTSLDAARTHLDQARALIKSSLAEARSSIWNLRSQSAEGAELPSRISAAAAQAANGGPMKLLFQVHGTYRAAPRQTEDQLLRIAQEAVNNAVQHAAAQQIEVTLNYNVGGLQLLIADNGRGFTQDVGSFAAGGHFGLRGMHERAREIGGKLDISSAEAEGTRISVTVDIP